MKRTEQHRETRRDGKGQIFTTGNTRTGLMASLPASPRGCVFFRVTVGVTQRSTGTEEEIDKRGASNPRYSRGDVGISELN